MTYNNIEDRLKKGNKYKMETEAGNVIRGHYKKTKFNVVYLCEDEDLETCFGADKEDITDITKIE